MRTLEHFVFAITAHALMTGHPTRSAAVNAVVESIATARASCMA